MHPFKHVVGGFQVVRPNTKKAGIESRQFQVSDFFFFSWFRTTVTRVRFHFHCNAIHFSSPSQSLSFSYLDPTAFLLSYQDPGLGWLEGPLMWRTFHKMSEAWLSLLLAAFHLVVLEMDPLDVQKAKERKPEQISNVNVLFDERRNQKITVSDISFLHRFLSLYLRRYTFALCFAQYFLPLGLLCFAYVRIAFVSTTLNLALLSNLTLLLRLYGVDVHLVRLMIDVMPTSCATKRR